MDLPAIKGVGILVAVSIQRKMSSNHCNISGINSVLAS